MPKLHSTLMRTIPALLACGAFIAATAPAAADKIYNPTAIFAGLDKITGRIISFEVSMDETVQFGSLQITPRVCISRPPKEAPLTDAFVEVDELGEKSSFKRIFSGWMFAASPGLHGVEHPVYDAWVTDCKGGTEVVATPSQSADIDPPPNADVLANTGKDPKAKETKRRAEPRQPPPGQDPTALAPSPQDLPTPRRAPTQSFFPSRSAQPNYIPQPLDPAGR